jgi:hypothetical protein
MTSLQHSISTHFLPICCALRGSTVEKGSLVAASPQSSFLGGNRLCAWWPAGHLTRSEIELEQLIEFAQRMIGTHSFIQVDAVTPKLLLPISAPHHIEARFYQISNCYSYIFCHHFGNRPSTADPVDRLDTSNEVGFRDRALLGTWAHTFARIGAVVNLKVEDYFQTGKRSMIRFSEKGGKETEFELKSVHELSAVVYDLSAMVYCI